MKVHTLIVVTLSPPTSIAFFPADDPPFSPVADELQPVIIDAANTTHNSAAKPRFFIMNPPLSDPALSNQMILSE
jgi:hypothetical protein